jgi:hypothetical protein
LQAAIAFKWDMPSLKIPTCVYPKIDEDSVLGKVRTAVDKGLDDTGNALTKAGQDAKRWWPDTVKWWNEHARQPKPPKDCDDDASYDQLETCKAGLEPEVEDEQRQLKKLRGGAKQWIDSQRSALGL